MKLGRLTLTFDRESINIPRLHWYRDGTVWGIGVSWGNGNSDPVWLIAWDGGKANDGDLRDNASHG